VAVSVISMIGFSLATAFASARNSVPLSKDHFFSEALSENNSRGVPGGSIIAVMVITIIIVLISVSVSKDVFVFLVAVSGIGRFLQYIPVSMAVLKARKLGIKGSFKLAFAGILVPISIIVSIICLVSSISHDLNLLWIGLIPLIVFSLLVWFFYSKPRAERLTK
jgi:amino acid transporter